MRQANHFLTSILIAIAIATTAVADAPDALARARETIRNLNAPLQQFNLDNGMTCLLKSDPSAPVASIQIWVGTGSIHEQEFLGSGLSHAIEHMLFQGTEDRGPNQITHEIDAAGGKINAYTTLDRVVFHTDLPSRHWRVGFDAVADAIMHARFPTEEWDQERAVILREFAMGYDDPQRVLNKLLWRTAFTEHPYRFPVIGYEDIFRARTRDDLVAFYNKHYTPDNMFLVIVGDIDIAEAKAHIETTFKDFRRRARAPVVLPDEPPQTAPRFARKTGSYQVTRLTEAYHTVALHHPDAVALDVLAAILGQGQSSHFVRVLREEERLVHSASAWSYTPRQPGLFGFTLTLDPALEKTAGDRLSTLILETHHRDYSDEEIAKAIRRVMVGELAALETAKGQASAYGSGFFFAGDPRFAETYLERLEDVTPEALRAVAATYLVPAHRTRVVLAPAATDAARDEEDEPPYTPVADPIRRKTANDVPVVIREDHRLPFVYFCIAMRGGLLSEDEDSNGVTQLMSDLLLRGTPSRNAQDIALAIESRGGSLSPFAGRNSVGLRGRWLSSDTEVFLPLVADCLINSTFPRDEFDKQQSLQLASIRRQHESPMFQARRELLQHLFSDHPYSMDPSGSTNSVSAMSRQDIEQHHRALLNANQMTLAVFGDVDPDDVLDELNRYFANLPENTTPMPLRPLPPPPSAVRVVRPQPRQQAIILDGFRGLDMFDPAGPSVEILERSLSGLASTLGESVRGQEALAYFVGAYHQPGLVPGAFVLYAGTQASTTNQVESLFRDEIHRVTTRGITQDELERARNQALAAHDQLMQDNGRLAMITALNELYGLGYDHTFSAPERLKATTTNTIREAAARILTTDHMVTSVVVPEAIPRRDQ